MPAVSVTRPPANHIKKVLDVVQKHLKQRDRSDLIEELGSAVIYIFYLPFSINFFVQI